MQLTHQPDVADIKSLIQTFFDAINESDTNALESLFFPNANLTILRQDPPLPPSATHYPQYASLKQVSSPASQTSDEEEEIQKGSLTVVIRTSIEKFIALLEEGKKRREGQPNLPELFEKPDLDATDVKVDTLYGSAWSPFSVTFDGVLHHYGTLLYSVGKVDKEGGGGEKVWKIESLVQNYRRTPGWEKAGEM